MSQPVDASQIFALKQRITALHKAKEQAGELLSLFFDLHLVEEHMQVHKIMHDIDCRIEQIEFLVERQLRKQNQA